MSANQKPVLKILLTNMDFFLSNDIKWYTKGHENISTYIVNNCMCNSAYNFYNNL